MYCERIAPGAESKTCREAGARTVFREKAERALYSALFLLRWTRC